MSTSSQQSSPANNALYGIIFTLSAGIGIPFARMVAPLIWPGLDGALGVRTVNLVSMGVTCGIVSLVFWGAAKLFRKRKSAAHCEQKPPSV